MNKFKNELLVPHEFVLFVVGGHVGIEEIEDANLRRIDGLRRRHARLVLAVEGDLCLLGLVVVLEQIVVAMDGPLVQEGRLVVEFLELVLVLALLEGHGERSTRL